MTMVSSEWLDGELNDAIVRMRQSVGGAPIETDESFMIGFLVAINIVRRKIKDGEQNPPEEKK